MSFRRIVIINYLLYFVSCSTAKKVSTGDGIRLGIHWEMANPMDGSILPFEDSTDIFYFGDDILYRIGVPVYAGGASNMRRVGDSTFIDQELKLNHLQYNYLLFRQTDSLGVKLDSLGNQLNEKFRVDSLLKARSLKGMVFYTENDSLVGERTEDQVYQRTFVPRKKIDESYADSMHLYFSGQYAHIPYSFSSIQDKAEKGKVFRVKLVYNPIKAGAVMIPARICFFEMKALSKEDVDQVKRNIRKNK